MIKTFHPFNIQPHIKRSRIDGPRDDQHQVISKMNDYYDILADVFAKDGERHHQDFLINTDIDLDYDETTSYGLVEYAALEDVSACVSYLRMRDQCATWITGIFGGEPFNEPFLIARPGFDMFKDFTITHNGKVYVTNDLRVDRSSFILPELVHTPEKAIMDMQGYLNYVLPIPGIGPMSMRVHELVGMTFWPKMYRNQDTFVYVFRNGDRTDCHFQNISGVLA